MRALKGLLISIVLLTLIGISGCDNFCFGDNLVCFTQDVVIKERLYAPESNSFTVTLTADDEFQSHQFTLAPLQTIDELSFGVWDIAVLRTYGAIKKIHVLNASALHTYQQEYVIPRKECPVTFMHQNLQSMLLIPANDAVAQQLENYDIPFDGHGTPFKLQGHHMQHNHSYFIEDDEMIDLTLPKYETAMSNFGTARHQFQYFLVTGVYP